MHIKVLGTKGEIEKSLPRHSKKSGVLIDGVLLLDIGEKEYLKYDPKWILITHLHPDHAYFMRKGHEESPATDALLFAPEPSKQGVGILRRKKKLGPYAITPIPTHHSVHVQSQAYLVQKGKTAILYTGDMVWIDKKYHKKFEHVDLVITEGSFIREGGMVRKDPKTHKLFGHNGIPNLIRLFCPHTETILFTHFGNWFFKNSKSSKKKLLHLGEKYHLEAIVGYDGRDLYLN